MAGCEQNMVDSIQELRELSGNEAAFRLTFPQTTIQVKILNALADVPEEDTKTDQTSPAHAQNVSDSEKTNHTTKPPVHLSAKNESGQELPEGKR